jgi:hypothetical protein
MINKDFQNGFIAGAVSGGVVEVEVEVSKPEQEKTVTITENGTTEVLPDENKALSRVTVITEVVGDGGTEEIEDLIDNSGVLDSTEGSVTEKLNQIIEYMKTYNQAQNIRFGVKNGATINKVVMNCKNVVSLNNAFYNCGKLKEVYLTNTSKVNNWGGTFAGGSPIHTIETLDMSDADKDIIGNKNYQWINDKVLENLKIVPLTIKNSITFVWCPSLTAESIQSIAYGLAYVTTAQTLTLNKVFENDFERLPAELRDLITNQKGWTLGFA